MVGTMVGWELGLYGWDYVVETMVETMDYG